MAKATAIAELMPPDVEVESPADAPVKVIKSDDLRAMGQKLDSIFKQYLADRRIAELRWLRNQRQYLGIYDPEIEKELSPNRSKAYPRITRVKCISVLARLMNLMFPGNERNWEIRASPAPDMTLADVKKAIQDMQAKDQAAGVQSQVDNDYITAAVQTLADTRAEEISTLIDDQLQELGGDQTYDYVALNRDVIRSGVIYGMGVLRGPFVKSRKKTTWTLGATGAPEPKTKTIYMPMFEFLTVWDFYPDMSAKTFDAMDGYFTRVVMSRSQVRALADREDFFKDIIVEYLKDHTIGNYKAQQFETELRAMGVKVNVNEMKSESSKYEVVVWHGPVNGQFLQSAGAEVADDKLSDELDAEIWMVDGNVIKASLNPWKALGVDVKTVHAFLFDEDDTSPIGFGLPNAIRDSQMAVSAATRMLLDNASVVCGPNLELNTKLLRPDQDLTSISPYKIWYRDDDDPATASQPAIRPITVDAHMPELQQIIELFMKFADAETFVGPATGGDMAQAPSEPMRTAAGASMLRGDAALPFKDIVRSFDRFTQSVIDSLVQFNRKFNPDKAREGEYDVIARGATSLIAKEVRGMQVDNLAQTLRPEEMMHVDERKLVDARFKVRDLGDLLLPEAEVARRKQAQDAQAAQAQQQTQQMAEAQMRKVLSDAFKNIAQGQKNSAVADATAVDAALKLLEQGVTNAMGQPSQGGAGADPSGPQPQGIPGNGADGQAGQPPAADGQGLNGGMLPGAFAAPSGGGAGLQ